MLSVNEPDSALSDAYTARPFLRTVKRDLLLKLLREHFARHRAAVGADHERLHALLERFSVRADPVERLPQLLGRAVEPRLERVGRERRLIGQVGYALFKTADLMIEHNVTSCFV